MWDKQNKTFSGMQLPLTMISFHPNHLKLTTIITCAFIQKPFIEELLGTRQSGKARMQR